MKLNPFKKPDTGGVETVEVATQEIEVAREKKYQALAAYTDGKPWALDRYVERARRALETHVHGAVELGKALLVIHEMTPRGEFQAVVEDIGLHPRTAYNYIKVATTFAGMDPQLAGDIGISKLYKMIKAPAEAIEQLESGDTFLDMDREELVTISTRELERRIKEVISKKDYDLLSEKAKNEELYEAKEKAQKEAETLRKQLDKATKGDTEHPIWWLRGMGVVTNIANYAKFLLEQKEGSIDAKQAEYIVSRIERELDEVRRALLDNAVDPVAAAQTREQKLAALQNDDRFDFSQAD